MEMGEDRMGEEWDGEAGRHWERHEGEQNSQCCMLCMLHFPPDSILCMLETHHQVPSVPLPEKNPGFGAIAPMPPFWLLVIGSLNSIGCNADISTRRV